MVNENISVAILLISMFTFWGIMMYALWNPKEPIQNNSNNSQK